MIMYVLHVFQASLVVRGSHLGREEASKLVSDVPLETEEERRDVSLFASKNLRSPVDSDRERDLLDACASATSPTRRLCLLSAPRFSAFADTRYRFRHSSPAQERDRRNKGASEPGRAQSSRLSTYLHGVTVLPLVQVLGFELPLLHFRILQGRQGVLHLQRQSSQRMKRSATRAKRPKD